MVMGLAAAFDDNYEKFKEIYTEGFRGETGIRGIEDYYASKTGYQLVSNDIAQCMLNMGRGYWDSEPLIFALGGYILKEHDVKYSLTQLSDFTGKSLVQLKEILEPDMEVLTYRGILPLRISGSPIFPEEITKALDELIQATKKAPETPSPAPSPLTTSHTPPRRYTHFVPAANTDPTWATHITFEEGIVTLVENTSAYRKNGDTIPSSSRDLFQAEARTPAEAIAKLVEAYKEGIITSLQLGTTDLSKVGFTLKDMVESGHFSVSVKPKHLHSQEVELVYHTPLAITGSQNEGADFPVANLSYVFGIGAAKEAERNTIVADAIVNGGHERIGFNGIEDFTKITGITAEQLETCGIPVNTLIAQREANAPTVQPIPTTAMLNTTIVSSVPPTTSANDSQDPAPADQTPSIPLLESGLEVAGTPISSAQAMLNALENGTLNTVLLRQYLEQQIANEGLTP